MEADRVARRGHLRFLLQLHPDWSQPQLADAVGCSQSTVSRRISRFAATEPDDQQVLFSRSRAPHHHRARTDVQVVQRIIEIREHPPEGLKRVPGPEAILYYLHRDEELLASGKYLPKSSRTIWKILDELGLMEREPVRRRQPRQPQEPMEEVQVDFKDAVPVATAETEPSEKRQHLIETCNFVDAGTSRLLHAEVREDFHAETAFEAVVAFLRHYGLPVMLTMDRDVRWVGSAAQREFPSALVQFLHVVGVIPNILPPQHPELNCFVERYHKTYKTECLQIVRPQTLEEVCTATAAFVEHYNHERPHQGRSCRNRPPCVAHPTLPKRPALPQTVDPDCWLTTLDGQCYPRQVRTDGTIRVDGLTYYVKRDLAGTRVLVRLSAANRSFEVLVGEQVVKVLPIKGLCGAPMALEAYIDLMRERARSEERQRQLQQRRQRWQARQSA